MILDKMIEKNLCCPNDLIGVPGTALDKIEELTEGKKGFFARAVKAAEKASLTDSAATSSGSKDKSDVASELANLFKKETVKVGIFQL